MENLEKILKQIKENDRVKQRVAFEDPFWFSLLYLDHHFTHSLAPFHLEMLHLIQKAEYGFVAVMAFRESGKSTIMNLSNVLWSILGKPQKKFVIIISKTQEQAKSHFLNIKTELENNEALKSDFGPFIESEDDMKRLSLELVYHGSKIMSVHIDQSVRGFKYGLHRPDLIICDDLEDTSTSTRKERDVLYDRFSKEIIPLGSSETRVIVLGNLLSEASLMMRIRNDIEKEKLSGIFRVYPLLDDYRNNLWQEKFKDVDAIKKLRAKLSKETWVNEYLLVLNENYDELSSPQNLRVNESDDHVILNWFHSTEAKLRNRYREELRYGTPQIHLIHQMEKYTISAPDLDSFINPEPGELLYEKYQEYKEEEKNLINEFHEALERALSVRSIEKENEKRVKLGLEPLRFTPQEKINLKDIEWEDDPEYIESDKLKEEILIVKKKRIDKVEKIREIGYWDGT